MDTPSAQSPATPPGLRYDQLLSTGRRGRWPYFVGIPALVVLVVAAQLAAIFGSFAVLLATGRPQGEVSELLGGDPVTPVYLAVVFLGWALSIPVVWLVVRVVHGLRPRWLTSVRPRLRWSWLLVCLMLGVAAMVVTLLLSALVVPAQEEALGMELGLNSWSREIAAFVLVVIVFTPLQAAGEEYVFRGYLLQATAGLTHSRVVAVLGSALVFAIAHGLGQSIPVFFDRFAFGLVAGLLVIVTGGLEAGIAMHLVNNFLAFGIALAFGDITEALHASGGSWWMVPVTVVKSLVYLGLVFWAARTIGLSTRSRHAVEPRSGDGGVLAGSGGPV